MPSAASGALRLLKEELAFDASRLPEQACPDFEAWRDAIDAHAVSLVFADAFLGNPSSMFGHTFLRLHKHRKRAKATRCWTIRSTSRRPRTRITRFSMP